MKRIIKKISLFVVIALSLILACPIKIYAITEQSSNVSNDTTNSSNNATNTTPSKNYQYSSYDYVIDKYDINIFVNENNTFDITETITVHYNVSRHGIIRTIPLKNTIARLDGTSSTNRAQVTNVSVDNEYKTSKENGNYNLKIGSAKHTVVGEQNYVIKYTYNIGKDPIKDYDELYYNIIGSEWDTVIGNVTFSITMPKEFDSSKLGFSSGRKGSTDNSKVEYSISGNKITGSYNGILGVGEALTIRCELPEGYFVGAKSALSLSIYLMFGIPILGLIISFILWFIFGRDEKIIETVEFYPPEGLNSLEIGFLYKGGANNKDVVSLLIYLANKGYIKITETEEKSLFSWHYTTNGYKITTPKDYEVDNTNGEKIFLDALSSISNTFKITKLKDYDGNNINEKIFLKNLFSKKKTVDFDYYEIKEIQKQAKQNGEKISYSEAIMRYNQLIDESDCDDVETVTLKDLYDKFYITIDKILSNINSKENKNKIFKKNTSGIILALLIILSPFTLIIIPTMEYAKAGELQETLFLCMLYLPFFAIGVFAKLPALFKTVWLVFLLFHSFGFFSSMPIAEALTNDNVYLLGFIIGILCTIGMTVFFKLMPKRTTYGTKILGKIKGFKNFLESAEKEKLEAMVMQDPTYFYDILPFTYVLGISDKWIKKFETISLQAPSWYNSHDAFDNATFGNFMNSTIGSAHFAMSSRPYSNSGSSSSTGGHSSSRSSSGGGSAGRGSGGGGGRSW